jgi:hypothetical protein
MLHSSHHVVFLFWKKYRMSQSFAHIAHNEENDMGELPSPGWTWSESVVAYGADMKSSTNSTWVNWSFRGKSHVLWVKDLIHLNNYNWHEMFKFSIFHINIFVCPCGLNFMCILLIYFSSIIVLETSWY